MSGWAVQALLGSAMLMLLMLILRGTFANLLGARAAYFLWALPAVRLILPPLPAFGPDPSVTMPIEIVTLGAPSAAASSTSVQTGAPSPAPPGRSRPRRRPPWANKQR